VKKESEFVSQVYTVVSSPDKNVRVLVVHTTRKGVCWGALVIRSIDSYSDSQGHHMIPKTVNRLHEQKDSSSKIKIQMQSTNIF